MATRKSKMTALLAEVILLAAGSMNLTAADPPPKLHVKVFTSTPEGFSVNSALVYGDQEAILIDTQFLMSEARRLAATIADSKKNLIAIYVTHPHPDHYFGLYVMKEMFPNARIVALPSTVAGIEAGWDARLKFWTPEYGGNLPPPGAILPEPLEGTTLRLEGQDLQIVGGVTGDSPGNNSYVWIPYLKTVVAGDTVFSGVHFTVPKMKEEWLKTLDQIAELKPAVIIPGHQIAGAKNDVSTLDFMRKYMRDYDKTLASSKSAAELRSKMKNRYPNLGLERLLNSAADAAFPAHK